MKVTGNIVVGQSGGPTAVINASVAGVYKAGKELGAVKVYGMVNGIQGFLKENLLDLDEYLAEEEGIELLKRTPAAFLGTCRYKLPVPEGHEDIYEQIFAVMEKYDIQMMLYVGGNDSMDTVKMLSDYAAEHGKAQRFVGIPKTIDNDLPVTDHCPGFGSAAKYIATSLKEIIRDNEAYEGKTKLILVEIMGRHAGWLTGAAGLAKGPDCTGVDAIYLPERVFDIDAFVAKIEVLAAQKSSVVIAVSEGVKLADGRFVSEYAAESTDVDVFGHKQVAGSCATLADIVEKRTGIKARVIEPSLLQRAATHIASLTDIDEAFAAGFAGVQAAAEGQTGVMITLNRVAGEPYKCETAAFDIHAIANQEKMVPQHFITEDGSQITEAFLTYLRPLIQGELYPIFKDGLPAHLVRR
ncbi:MAG: 6-phosphofructokinase [Lachnospiraceae bacterium]|nr:6-phosphofructokinase [Lachnospiraceae bacterium]